MKKNQYVLVTCVLFGRNFEGVILRFLDHSNSREILQEFHNGVCGGHFSPVVTTHIIIRVGYYWRTMLKYPYELTRKCIPCHTFSGKMKRNAMPLQSTVVEKQFAQWGLDVIGPINLKSSKGHGYVITATYYFTKRKEVVALRNADSEQFFHFIKENILLRFCVPEKFITYNGSIFIGSKFTNLCGKYGIIMGNSTNYYPQGNGLAESTNNELIQIIKKTIEVNHKNWHNKLIDALWESFLTPKDSIGYFPYILMYEKEAILPLHLELNSFSHIETDENEEEQSPMKKIYNEILQLEEQREHEILTMNKRK
jgi:hypothetical protein